MLQTQVLKAWVIITWKVRPGNGVEEFLKADMTITASKDCWVQHAGLNGYSENFFLVSEGEAPDLWSSPSDRSTCYSQWTSCTTLESMLRSFMVSAWRVYDENGSRWVGQARKTHLGLECFSVIAWRKRYAVLQLEVTTSHSGKEKRARYIITRSTELYLCSETSRLSMDTKASVSLSAWQSTVT